LRYLPPRGATAQTIDTNVYIIILSFTYLIHLSSVLYTLENNVPQTSKILVNIP
jgi:hypothetical protein